MILASGAEAVIERIGDQVIKRRVEKHYCHPELDIRLRRERTRAEARLMSAARRCGVPTPIIQDLDSFTITMEYIEGTPLKHCLDQTLARLTGKTIGRLHNCGIIHGDLTTSNLLYSQNRIYLLDFGLAFFDSTIEARGVDLHVFFQTLKSSHEQPGVLEEAFREGYQETMRDAMQVFQRVGEIEKRRRYA